MPTLLTTLIRRYPPSFPADYCYPAQPQQFANDLVNGMTLEFASDIGSIAYNIGDTLPSAENRIFPWFRTIGGYPDDWYKFVGGSWLTAFKGDYADPGDRQLWEGLEANVPTKDGGEVGPVTLTSGPFWEIDHNYDGRSPMGPGNIQDATPAKTLSVGENFGEGSHMQVADEIGPHLHPFQAGASIQSGNNVKVVTSGGGAVVGLQIGGSGNADTDLSVGANTFTTTQQKTPIIHPVRGIWMLKRTARVYQRVDV